MRAGTSWADADDPKLTADVWRERIRPHGGELKNLLKDQSFVGGIGNGYSDEMLWEARLAPFRKRSTLAPDEVDALYDATRRVPAWAIKELRRRVPPRYEVEVRDFLRVHRKGGSPAPGAAPPSATRRWLRDQLVPDLPALIVVLLATSTPLPSARPAGDTGQGGETLSAGIQQPLPLHHVLADQLTARRSRGFNPNRGRWT